jgi:hypothetical protein
MTEQIEGREPETRFTEIDVGGTTIGLVSDVANERAWIQSDLTVEVDP